MWDIPANIDEQTSARGLQVLSVYYVVRNMKLCIREACINFRFTNRKKVSWILYQQISNKTVLMTKTIDVDMSEDKILCKPFSKIK